MTCCVQGAVVAAATGPSVVELVYGQLHSSHGGLPPPTAAGAGAEIIDDDSWGR
jgi:hypothetical protein